MRCLSAIGLLFLALMPLRLSAQGGRVAGGLESDSVWSVDGHFYSNNYLKLDYARGRFSAGIQAEYYPDPLPGYDINLKGVGLPGKYVAWTDKTWSLTAGDFHDQFGSGILLRSWEDRALGWNNSIGGGRFTWRTRDECLALKVLGGFTRRYLCYSSDRVGALASVCIHGRALHWREARSSATTTWQGMRPGRPCPPMRPGDSTSGPNMSGSATVMPNSSRWVMPRAVSLRR